MSNDSENSGLDGTVILAVIAGADVVVDRRTRTIHTFNSKTKAAVEDLESLGMGPSSNDEQMFAFLRALAAQGLTLFGIQVDGGLCRLVDKVETAPDVSDEGG